MKAAHCLGPWHFRECLTVWLSIRSSYDCERDCFHPHLPWYTWFSVIGLIMHIHMVHWYSFGTLIFIWCICIITWRKGRLWREGRVWSYCKCGVLSWVDHHSLPYNITSQVIRATDQVPYRGRELGSARVCGRTMVVPILMEYILWYRCPTAPQKPEAPPLIWRSAKVTLPSSPEVTAIRVPKKTDQ